MKANWRDAPLTLRDLAVSNVQFSEYFCNLVNIFAFQKYSPTKNIFSYSAEICSHLVQLTGRLSALIGYIEI